ncbi:uncharacterized protein VTP21DRAFT_3583 [Calcarisporiella thermophila]|uniref:uncharacterized protein n=1 Tax=Calcarisporiella thermophila TaxID=911321 RepID=UPI0037438B7F
MAAQAVDTPECFRKELSGIYEKNYSLLAQLEQLRESNKQLSLENAYFRKKYTASQREAQEARDSHTRLENQLFAQEQDVSTLRRENQTLLRSKRDLERKIAKEVGYFEEEKVAWQKREAELKERIQRLRREQAGGNEHTDRRRGSSDSSDETSSPCCSDANSPAPNSEAVDEEAVLVRERKIASTTIRAQDRYISELRAELDRQRNVTHEYMVRLQNQSLRMTALENEVSQVMQVNRRLMEENEGYQILLHERTISGEFMLNPLLQPEKSPVVQEENANLNLAEELERASADSTDMARKEEETNHIVERMGDEIRHFKDENKALILYINKILTKIMENKHLIELLSIDPPSSIENIRAEKVEEKKIEVANDGGKNKEEKKEEPRAQGEAASSMQRRRRLFSATGPTPLSPTGGGGFYYFCGGNVWSRRSVELGDNRPKSMLLEKEDEESTAGDPCTLRRRQTVVASAADHPAGEGSWSKVFKRMSWKRASIPVQTGVTLEQTL